MKAPLTFSLVAVGLDINNQQVKTAKVQKDFKEPFLKELLSYQPTKEELGKLSEEDLTLATAIAGKETLVRMVTIPLTSEKDILAALPFQAETLLPYPIEEAILSYQMIKKHEDSTSLTIFAVRKESVEKELERCQKLGFDPEKISCVPAALGEFADIYLPFEKKYFVLDLQPDEMSCLLIQKGKVLAAYSEPIDSPIPKNLHDDQTTLLSLQRKAVKICYSLSKETEGEELEGIAVTGEAAKIEGLSEVLTKLLPYSLLKIQNDSFSSSQLLENALPIGLALSAISNGKEKCNFRKDELVYPTPWKRLKPLLFLYAASILLLTLAFNFFTNSYLRLKEDEMRQSYLDLLAGMNRSHKTFEEIYGLKHPEIAEEFSGDIPNITQLSAKQIDERLDFLQKELQSSPDSFPLFPNIPRVSDVLAWLAQHDAVTYQDEKGNPNIKLHIENFNYVMVKRPQQGKKTEKYQVKIELEFSTSTPKWAREFHDALIATNDLVDPKAEVKWSSNRGKYKTSFFLKDKTTYPSS